MWRRWTWRAVGRGLSGAGLELSWGTVRVSRAPWASPTRGAKVPPVLQGAVEPMQIDVDPQEDPQNAPDVNYVVENPTLVGSLAAAPRGSVGLLGCQSCCEGWARAPHADHVFF